LPIDQKGQQNLNGTSPSGEHPSTPRKHMQPIRPSLLHWLQAVCILGFITAIAPFLAKIF